MHLVVLMEITGKQHVSFCCNDYVVCYTGRVRRQLYNVRPPWSCIYNTLGAYIGGHYTAYVKYPTKLDDPAKDDSNVHSWDHEGHSSKQHHFAKSKLIDASGFVGSEEFPSESHFALIVLLLTIMTLLFLSLGISLLHLVIIVLPCLNLSILGPNQDSTMLSLD